MKNINEFSILKTRVTDACQHSGQINAHFEAEVLIDKQLYYFNFEVEEGEPAEIFEDSHWTYNVPLDDVDFNIVEDFEFYPDEAVEKVVLDQMCKIWNSDPSFKNMNEWKDVSRSLHMVVSRD